MLDKKQYFLRPTFARMMKLLLFGSVSDEVPGIADAVLASVCSISSIAGLAGAALEGGN